MLNNIDYSRRSRDRQVERTIYLCTTCHQQFTVIGSKSEVRCPRGCGGVPMYCMTHYEKD